MRSLKYLKWSSIKGGVGMALAALFLLSSTLTLISGVIAAWLWAFEAPADIAMRILIANFATAVATLIGGSMLMDN